MSGEGELMSGLPIRLYTLDELRAKEGPQAFPLQCDASRGPRSTVRCERPALHCRASGHFGRSRRGYWFGWRDA